MFAIATHIPSAEIGTGYFQETDPMGMFAGCCNYVAMLSSPDQMPRLSQLALQAAILDRGVGMVVLPGDIAAAKVDQPVLEHAVVTGRPLARPAETELDAARDLIEGAKRIVIYGGEGTRAARDEVLELSDTLKAPVAYAYRGKDVLEHDNPAAVGMIGLLGWGAATYALGKCDLMIMLGSDFPYRAFIPGRSEDHPGRRSAASPRAPGEDRPRPGRRRRRDPAGAAAEAASQRSDSAFLDGATKKHAKAVKDLRTYVDHQGSGEGLRPEMVADALSELAEPDAVFTVDTGMCNVWGARYLQDEGRDGASWVRSATDRWPTRCRRRSGPRSARPTGR